MRELLKCSEVLIFDEPTKGLDENSKKKLMDLIRQYRGRKTILLVSHDRRDLSMCDKIIELTDLTVKESLC